MSIFTTLCTLCLFMSMPVQETEASSATGAQGLQPTNQSQVYEEDQTQNLLAQLAAEDPDLTRAEIAAALGNREVLFDYFFDPAKTISAGFKIILCSGQVIQYGTVTPYYFISFDPCEFSDL